MCTIYISHFEETKKQKYQTEHNAGLRLLSYALSHYANIFLTDQEMSEEIGTEEWGKPYLKSYPNIHFNISHCSDMVVCAVDSSPIGVDVEKIQGFLDSIIRKTLTSQEKAFFEEMSQNEDLKQEWFFRFWTLKESRIKHSGLGLSMSLTDFSFSYDIKKDPYEISCSEEGLSFYQQIIEENYILALCTTHPQPQPQIINVIIPPA